MKTLLQRALAAAAIVAATQAGAQITFYERNGFEGRSFTTDDQVVDFARRGFNDRASSVVVLRDRWEVCEDMRFGGRCAVLRPGRYPSLESIGLNDRISSVRIVDSAARVDDRRYPPPPMPVYDARRRPDERLFEADVVSVRAVMGAPEQRCWVEREQVQDRGRPNIGGALAGAVIGGILGHQVGGGSGRDLATAGAAVAGAAVGSNVNRDGGVRTQDVQRCENVQSQARPQYWDVTYNFRGQEHHVQMTAPPGPTITVNRMGEPRA